MVGGAAARPARSAQKIRNRPPRRLPGWFFHTQRQKQGAGRARVYDPKEEKRWRKRQKPCSRERPRGGTQSR
nr:MAG TPA: hypothetical protein [Caudoviricetes sp.]